MIDQIVAKITTVIDPQYVNASTFYAKENKANFYSLIVKALPSPYRSDLGEHLFARVKTKGKNQYISFSKSFEKKFNLLHIPYT